jgi:hypothetical protein
MDPAAMDAAAMDAAAAVGGARRRQAIEPARFAAPPQIARPDYAPEGSDLDRRIAIIRFAICRRRASFLWGRDAPDCAQVGRMEIWEWQLR